MDATALKLKSVIHFFDLRFFKILWLFFCLVRRRFSIDLITISTLILAKKLTFENSY